MQGRFMQRNFAGVEGTSAYKAIADIRAQLDELNPGNDGDLMQPRKLLGASGPEIRVVGFVPDLPGVNPGPVSP